MEKPTGTKAPWWTPGVFASVIAGLVLLYALGGFLLVPWLAKRELPRVLDEQLHRRASVGAIEFNPFTLKLLVRDFALAEQDGQSMLSLKEAGVDLEWRSLVRRGWMFSTVRLVEPAARIEISRTGVLNLAALAPASQTGAPSAPAHFAVGELAIENGRIDFDDQHEGYKNRLERLSLKLSSLSNMDPGKGPYALSAHTADGATLQWKGELALEPFAATGTLAFEHGALPQLTPYLDEFLTAQIVSGRVNINLPYRFTLAAGKPHLTITGAKVVLQEFALAAPKAQAPFAKLGELVLDGVNADSQTNHVSASALRVSDVSLEAKRNAGGELDLAQIFIARPASTAKTEAKPFAWQASIDEIVLGNFSANYADATAKIPLAVAARGLQAKFRLNAESDEHGLRWRADANELALAEVQVGTTAPAPPALKVAGIAVTGARFDSGGNTLDVDATRVASLNVDAALADGKLFLLDLIPATSSAKSAKPLTTRVKSVELANGSVNFSDRASGTALALQRLTAKLNDFTSDTAKPLAFEIGADVQSGGSIKARGRATPASGNIDAHVEVARLLFAPLQPIATRFAGIKIAGGEVSLAGDLRSGSKEKEAKLTYTGSATVADVAIQDETGEQLLGWKSLSTKSLRVMLTPNRIRIDELDWVAPSGKLAIAADQTTNVGRAFRLNNAAAAPAPGGAEPPKSPDIQKPVAAAPAETPGAKEPDKNSVATESDKPDEAMSFTVRVRRIDITHGALDFSDQTISPGFATAIRELAGTINGVSSDRNSRSQFSLEGQVDEYGYARLSGALNPFAPRNRTNFRVEFRNLDVTKVSPYSIKFAGYRIASGRLSLDLNYRLNENRLEGDNKILLDQFTLGEKVDSPTALKLPLELAVSLLKDADGKINFALPISGNLDDPQFDYRALIGQAIRNLIVKVITAPFRALAHLFGARGEEVGHISFEPGSSRLLPPEREKLGHIAEAMTKRTDLKLVIPARYDTEADTRALKRVALRRDVGKKAGFEVNDDDPPGALSIEDRRTRSAVRALFAERFSSAELDKVKTEAEAKSKSQAAESGGKPAQLSVLDRLGRFAKGEPQVADAGEFYRTLGRRLLDAQQIAANALPELAQKRAAAIADALKAAGADPARIAQSTAEPNTAHADAKEVTLDLSLSSTAH